MRYKLPSFGTTVAGVFVAAALGGMYVDHALNTRAIEPVPNCRRLAPECEAALKSRREERERRSEAFDDRVWLYALVVVATIAAATGLALRRRPGTDRRTIFADLGSVAVVLGVLHGVALWLTESALIEVPGRPGWAVVGSLLAAAAAGGTLSRRGDAPAELRAVNEGLHTYAGYAARGGAALTVVTLILALNVVEQSWLPCDQPRPDWYDTVWSATVGVACGAGALVLLGLLARRWVNAAVCLSSCSLLLLMARSPC